MKCPISSKFGISRQIFLRGSSIKFQRNPFIVSRADICRKRDKQMDMIKVMGALSDHANAHKNLSPLPETEHRVLNRQIHSIVTTSTEIYRLLQKIGGWPKKGLHTGYAQHVILPYFSLFQVSFLARILLLFVIQSPSKSKLHVDYCLQNEIQVNWVQTFPSPLSLQFMSFVQPRDVLHKGWTIAGRQVAPATELCSVVSNICGPSVWNLLHVTLLVPRILMWLQYFLNLPTIVWRQYQTEKLIYMSTHILIRAWFRSKSICLSWTPSSTLKRNNKLFRPIKKETLFKHKRT